MVLAIIVLVITVPFSIQVIIFCQQSVCVLVFLQSETV